jgi:hypothetical protein
MLLLILQPPHFPPPMSDNLTILSVNMNRQNAALTVLLKTTKADILLVQEPWWGTLVPGRSDKDPEGLEVRRTC